MTAKRAEFLATIAALALAGCARSNVGALAASAAPSPVASAELARFMALSSALTGYSDLDTAAGAAYLQAILANPANAAALAALYDDPAVKSGAPIVDPAASSAADRVLASWYSGIAQTANGGVTQTWTGALAWRACSFTKPPSTCAAPGSWAHPPAGAA